MEIYSISYLHPTEPMDATTVVAALVHWADADWPLTIRKLASRWVVEFAALSDEGDLPTFTAAVLCGHNHALRCVQELLRATPDGSL